MRLIIIMNLNITFIKDWVLWPIYICTVPEWPLVKWVLKTHTHNMRSALVLDGDLWTVLLVIVSLAHRVCFLLKGSAPLWLNRNTIANTCNFLVSHASNLIRCKRRMRCCGVTWKSAKEASGERWLIRWHFILWNKIAMFWECYTVTYRVKVHGLCCFTSQ